MTKDPATQPEAADKLRELITRYFISRALYAVAAVDVAGALARASKSTDELATELGVHAPSLYRILRALAAHGIFHEDDAGCFSNTPMSELLRQDVAGSLRDLALLFGHETSWRSWEAIVHTLKSGEAAFEHTYGEKFFDYLQIHPDTAAMFDRAMVSASSTAIEAVLEAYDFSGLRSLVDVAGGVGAGLCSIVQATPGLHGILFDLPHVADRALEFIARQRLNDRCEFIAGSFFESVPGEGDIYTLARVLLNWPDEDVVKILRTLRRSMRNGTKLLILDYVLNEPDHPAYRGSILQDLSLFVTFGGAYRTRQEWLALIKAGSFRLLSIRQAPQPSFLTVIEVEPC